MRSSFFPKSFLHDLRHTAITNDAAAGAYAAAGASELAVMAKAGHRSMSTTKTYLIWPASSSGARPRSSSGDCSAVQLCTDLSRSQMISATRRRLSIRFRSSSDPRV